MKLPLVAVITLSSLLVAPAAFAQDANPGAQSRQATKPVRLHTQERRALYERIRDRIRRALSRPSTETTRQTKPGKPRLRTEGQASSQEPRTVKKPGKPLRKKGLRKKGLGKKGLAKKGLAKKPGKPVGKPGKPVGKPGDSLRKPIKKPRPAVTRRTSQEATQPTANPHPPSSAQRPRGNSSGLSGMIRGMGNGTQEQSSRGAGNPH